MIKMTDQQFERYLKSQNHIATAIEELTATVVEIAQFQYNNQ
tara:strand:- start:372 stop:497 length:126 start_codon:yes stop_codon:yes gene_type:complete